MDRWHSHDRKALVTTLGTVGLGLGLIIATASGAPGAAAQEASMPTIAQDESGFREGEVREHLRPDERREELYAEFTAALAEELGISNSDEVDAAIRVAMMTLVEARVDGGLLTTVQAEALKELIATSDVPLGPGPMFGPPPGPFIRGGLRFGEGVRFLPIRRAEEPWVIPAEDGSPANEREDRDTGSNANDDSGSDQDDAGCESS
jgi:hypothetical protein